MLISPDFHCALFGNNLTQMGVNFFQGMRQVLVQQDALHAMSRRFWAKAWICRMVPTGSVGKSA